MQNKRIWAMVGVVYMVLLTLLMTYWIATTNLLTGLTALMLWPLVTGMAVQCFNNRWKVLHQQASGNPAVFALLGAGCSVGSLLCLYFGVLEVIRCFA